MTPYLSLLAAACTEQQTETLDVYQILKENGLNLTHALMFMLQKWL